MSRSDDDHFARARRETVRYHEELYASASVGEAGSWLQRPHRLLSDALAHFSDEKPMIVYDLGCGVGRHTIPLLRCLPNGSRVYAVDLLESALGALEGAAPPATHVELRRIHADLVDFEFNEPADLIFAFSAVEHLPSAGAIRRMFIRISDSLTANGVLALGMVVDRYEEHSDGTARPALLESRLSSRHAQRLLASAFDGYEILSESMRPTQVREARDGTEYWLRSTLVSVVLRKT